MQTSKLTNWLHFIEDELNEVRHHIRNYGNNKHAYNYYLGQLHQLEKVRDKLLSILNKH